MNGPAGILFSLAIILLAGFLMTRLTKLAKLPNVTGYILAGVIIGPHVLRLIPVNIIDGMGFISDIALAFIAFGVGRFFKREAFRQPGPVLVITLLESLAPMFLITLSMRLIFRLDWEFSLLLGAIATATAPASTMVTIRQYKAKGNFVYTL
ncbi:MAG TPA: cation:proton antiporter, partial [Oscillospiraceae bacterium]|nr:cation:proton antiporter [Oscillospiraceae bacterium]